MPEAKLNSPVTARPSWLREMLRGRCQFLFFSLVALLLLYPYADLTPGTAVAILVLNSATLIAGVYAVSDSKWKVVLTTALAIAQFATAVTAVVLDTPLLHGAEKVLLVSFYGYTLVQVLRFVVGGQEVTQDKIFGALSVYLLMGLAWASLYGLLSELQPNAFSIARGSGNEDVFASFVYFSYVTLTTLGYGDITPLTPEAQSLTFLEAICGVMYVAVLVARLVSMYRPPAEVEGRPAGTS